MRVATRLRFESGRETNEEKSTPIRYLLRVREKEKTELERRSIRFSTRDLKWEEEGTETPENPEFERSRE